MKGIAQLGATLGREFSYELLQAVSPWDEETLRRGLHQLVEAEFLYQRGVPPQATYLFKHALIQDAAYQSLLRSTRQQYHQHIAQVLLSQFPETAETQPELLAQHYTEAGLQRQAVAYWQRAGEAALQRAAHVEASAYLTTGLELVTTLPPTPERHQQELALHLALGSALNVSKGYGAPEVERAYIRARALAFLYGVSHGAASLAYAAMARWLLGFPQQALQYSRAALSLAQESRYPASLALPRAHAAWLHQFRRAASEVQAQAEALLALAHDQGFPFWSAMATILHGWALMAQGQSAVGISQMQQGLATYQATGAAMGQTYLRALLVEGYEKMGQVDAGLRLLAEILATVESTGERMWEAELYRLKGMLLLQQCPSDIHQVETCFQTALTIARLQQAKSLELRAAMSLSWLWRQRGKHQEARQALAEVYGWFTGVLTPLTCKRPRCCSMSWREDLTPPGGVSSGIEKDTVMRGKAEEHLRSAEFPWRHGQYRDAVSRAYYASFAAMCAFVGEPPHGRWEHPGLRGVFVQQLSGRGVPATECRRLRQRLRSLHDARTDADYTTVAVDATTVQEALAIARDILEIVRRYEQR